MLVFQQLRLKYQVLINLQFYLELKIQYHQSEYQLIESKRDFNEDGTPFYKKHKIYLYKEDFESFQNALTKVSEFIIKEKGTEVISNSNYSKKTSSTKDEGTDSTQSSFTEVDLDELS